MLIETKARGAGHCLYTVFELFFLFLYCRFGV